MSEKSSTLLILLKMSFIFSITAFSWWFWYADLITQAGQRLNMDSPLPLSQCILILWWVLLLLIIADLLFRKKISIYALTAVYAFSFFTGNDALWASELVWHKQELMTILPPLIFILLFAVVIYRADPTMKWMYGKKTATGEPQPGKWNELSGANKTFTIIGITVAFVFAMYVPCKVNLTIGYLSAAEPVIKHAKVIGAGSTRGKYYYHRYWRLMIDGKEEKFWVYAAAKTEPVAAHTCSTNPDPEPGSELKIQGRNGIYGFSYDKVLWIKGSNGAIICD